MCGTGGSSHRSSLIAIRRTDCWVDHDLDIGAQPAGLGGKILSLLAAAGAGGEQQDTPAHYCEVPAHSRQPLEVFPEMPSSILCWAGISLLAGKKQGNFISSGLR